jgi:Aspartyl protease
MNDLAQFLTSSGYIQIPLSRSVVGHFHTAGTLNGHTVEVLVDTGAACTVVALSVVEALGLQSEFIDANAGGAGGALDQFFVHGGDLRLGSFLPRVPTLVGINFEHINAPLLAQGSAEVHVILGMDVFDAHAAVIEYAGRSLFLKAAETEPGEAAR